MLHCYNLHNELRRKEKLQQIHVHHGHRDLQSSAGNRVVQAQTHVLGWAEGAVPCT